MKPNFSLREKNSFSKTEDSIYFSHNPEAQVEHTAGILICSNDQCMESVAYCGLITYEVDIVVINGFPQPDIYQVFHPKYFFPALTLFQISKNGPNQIKGQIEKAFSHFFNDTSACANSIRTALELIMDDQKISKTLTTKKQELLSLSLHRRIEIFGEIKPELEPFLIAAKWIGNAGSHNGDISKEAIFDGFELIEHCIDELYEKETRMRELNDKAAKINKGKKPL